MKRLRLTRDERAWLRRYGYALARQYPGVVQQLLIYGSKARGEAGPESDLDLLLIVRDGAGRQKRRLRWLGYMLAAPTTVVPSILAYTAAEWASRKRGGLPFPRAVEQDAVPVR